MYLQGGMIDHNQFSIVENACLSMNKGFRKQENEKISVLYLNIQTRYVYFPIVWRCLWALMLTETKSQCQWDNSNRFIR